MQSIKMKKYTLLALAAATLLSCNSGEETYDATGVFEATEVIVSAESAGQILALAIEEGDELKAGDKVGNVDCENASLQKAQVSASIEALSAKQNSAAPQTGILKQQLITQQKQLSSLQTQLATVKKEQSRVQKLVAAEAAPSKQLDDVDGQVELLTKQLDAATSQLNVIRQQIKAQEEQVAIGNRAVMSERKPLEERLAQMENMVGKCTIANPVDGTVLTKYAETNEITAPGKPLYKIADMKELFLRAYITGAQLAQVKTGQQVTVLVDNGEDSYKELPGTITWIASKAEFTPKTIQTKDERANLVYALKVKVKNDGYLKLGMYGELKF